MNSHDSRDSRDPDFPQDIPAIPDAKAATPPDALQDGIAPEPSGNVVEPLSARPQDVSLDSPLDSPLDSRQAELPPETLPQGGFPIGGSQGDTSTPDPFAPPAPESDPAIPTEPVSPEVTAHPAAEVWTELDEAEPAATADWQKTPEDSPAWASVSSEERGEPGSSTGNARAKAGSGPRREAEKPGRTVYPYDDWEPSEVPYQPKELGLIDQLMIVLAQGATLWRKVLRQVRSWLPTTWQRRLSDELMTAIALGILILWLVLWNPWGKQAAPSPVAIEPPGRPAPTQPQEDDGGSRLALQAGDGDEAASAIQPPAEPPEPSPEQTLIADIQTRVSTLSRSYAVGLIQSVEVNLPQQVLAVNLSNDWYGLGSASQDRIAQDIYTQAQGLAFSTLQLRDAEGLIVARNPVVGPSMVILKRHRPTEGDPLL